MRKYILSCKDANIMGVHLGGNMRHKAHNFVMILQELESLLIHKWYYMAHRTKDSMNFHTVVADRD